MEPVSIASVTLASILATLSVSDKQESQSVITTHISPAIAGQWEIDLDKTNAFDGQLSSSDDSQITDEPAFDDNDLDGVSIQTQKRIVRPISNPATINSKDSSNTSDDFFASTSVPADCREIYYFGPDNEMWAVSGKERTYARYLITHGEAGLPIIAIKTVYDNNEMDCSGNQIDQTNEAIIAFMNHQGNTMQWCADPDGEECFMHFDKILP